MYVVCCMYMMIRTQVYLPKSLYRDIKLAALKDKKPTAQVLREALIVGLEKKKPKETLGQAMQELIDLGKKLKISGPTDLSTNHDKYLYEDE